MKKMLLLTGAAFMLTNVVAAQAIPATSLVSNHPRSLSLSSLLASSSDPGCPGVAGIKHKAISLIRQTEPDEGVEPVAPVEGQPTEPTEEQPTEPTGDQPIDQTDPTEQPDPNNPPKGKPEPYDPCKAAQDGVDNAQRSYDDISHQYDDARKNALDALHHEFDVLDDPNATDEEKIKASQDAEDANDHEREVEALQSQAENVLNAAQRRKDRACGVKPKVPVIIHGDEEDALQSEYGTLYDD